MAKYRVYFETSASSVVEVEADDRQAAIESAYDEHYASLCHQCARDVELGDFDVPVDKDWAVELVE